MTPPNKLSRKPAGTLDLPAVYEKAVRNKGRSAEDARKHARGFKKTALALLREAPLNLLDDLAGTAAFDRTQLRWLADHVVSIERAWNKRWRGVLRVLARADASRHEELAHLVVVAGVALVQSGVVDLDELRTWISSAGANQAWALPIEIAIDKQVGS